MINHCAQHALYHIIVATNNDTISPFQIRIYLQESLEHLPHYVATCTKYNSEYPLPPNRNFDGLRAALIVAESNRSPAAPAPTAASIGFAAATKAPSDVHEDIRSLQAKMAALLKVTSGTTTAPRRTFVMGPKAQHYCWTHGMCDHGSSGCRAGKLNPKHDTTATRAQPGVGGSTWGL